MESENIRLRLQKSSRQVSVFVKSKGEDLRGKIFRESAGDLISAGLTRGFHALDPRLQETSEQVQGKEGGEQ